MAVVEREGMAQVSDVAAIGLEIEAVLAEFPSQVAEYRAGKAQLLGFLVGQVMRRTAGRADAKQVNEELRRRLIVDVQ
jgi:aspartyl-tRNA(Asn)/glutamyl-tRNA(Gln) amidotransferase subunit B